MVKGGINSSINPDEFVNIGVTVKDENGNPLQDATVTLTNLDKEYTGKTGSAGGCTISNVPFANYTILVYATGYEDYMDDISVDETTSKLNIILNGV